MGFLGDWFNGFLMDNKGPTFNLVMAWILFLSLGYTMFNNYGHVKAIARPQHHHVLRGHRDGGAFAPLPPLLSCA